MDDYQLYNQAVNALGSGPPGGEEEDYPPDLMATISAQQQQQFQQQQQMQQQGTQLPMYQVDPNLQQQQVPPQGNNGGYVYNDYGNQPQEEPLPPLPPLNMEFDPYISWTSDESGAVSPQEIREVFEQVRAIFGFQPDSATNMYEHLMVQLDSRSSRMPAYTALLTLHADYIGGENANYRKWYFCCLQEDDPELFDGVDIHQIKKKLKRVPVDQQVSFYPKSKSEVVEFRWRERMRKLSPKDMVRQLALYLLVWGEANNIRFTPECLCFIFKCALDYMDDVRARGGEGEPVHRPERDYLHRVINPIYNFYHNQLFKKVDGKDTRKEKDHHLIIGYDDINQLFWYRKGLDRLKIGEDKKPLLTFPKEERYLQLGNVVWSKAFYKTYREKRSWFHLVTNFSRVWILHLTMFWYFSSFNSPTLYTANYEQQLNNQPKLEATFSVTALGSTIGCLIQIVATIGEWSFVPIKWPGSKPLFKRLVLLILITIVNFGPSVFVLGIVPLNATSRLGLGLSIAQFCISLVTTVWFIFQPLANLFKFSHATDEAGYDPMKTFTASYPRMTLGSRALSILLWMLVFSCKFIESYFFLTLSLRDPIRNLDTLDLSRCQGESIFGAVGHYFCAHQGKVVLFLMYTTDLVLYFLDTYLWFIIWNCIMSLSLSFSSGISILSPWRNVFTRMPQRIQSKLLSTKDMQLQYPQELLVSQIWNAIVISMYREHLLSSDHVHRLIYDKLPDEESGKMALRVPSFFLVQDDNSSRMSDFFVRNSEAERRISYFAQSLSTTMPEPIPVEAMPAFTVLVPHYGEKIMLNLREVIKEDPNSKMSLLEYLKQMFPHEWKYFVRDTKILSSSSDADQDYTRFETEKEYTDNLISDMPFYCIGFKSETPAYTLRTRIWASLRSQTLYRTVSGFMNYKRAIKLMHRVENPEMVEFFGGDNNSEAYLNHVADRKFRMLVAMQRLQKFNESEKEDLQVMLNSFPGIKIACLEEEPGEDGETKYYSVLYETEDSQNNLNDGDENDNLDQQPTLRQVFKVELSGNPILGDGKSDNQNNVLIFYRGEYIEVIDANQDNYLEECLKIRSVLSEFENFDYDALSPYVHSTSKNSKPPVAILGAREYIFSEHTGVLGDVSASKEQTFGTMFARTLAALGAKLHYGHPDFINAIFMTTRGGISKAQKGLHLNEDIYAGMTALCRGGRIKHCDYFQCGKGRDLGFGSVLNFTTKIGGGMGEQMLSREYYYLGTQMPLDRFLSFYYAHPGFHLNNLFIILSLGLFTLVAFNLGSMKHELILCLYDKNVPITDLQLPIGCQNLQPVLDWVTIYVLSIFICFFITFLPLVLHEVSERGPWKACKRLSLHFACLSPVFEVFVCQIYATSLKNDIALGGARYISTGRGYSISRISFTKLYTSYASTCLYSGMRLFLVLLFAVITMWQPALLWFWITFASLCFSPFLFNPHQFSWTEFFLDYREFIRWMGREDPKSSERSWVGYLRQSRSRITGFKKPKKAGRHQFTGQIATANFSKPPFVNVVVSDVFVPLLEAVFVSIGYLFINAQNGVKRPVESNPLIRLGALTLLPFVLNAVALLCIFPMSCLVGPLLSKCCKKGPRTFAGVAHTAGLLIQVCMFEVIWVLEGWSVARTLACFTATVFLQRALIEAGKVFLLSRELREDFSNQAWWSGKWVNRGVGIKYAITQPIRELVVKVFELSLFAVDFAVAHLILFLLTPLLFVPYIDHWHSCLLLWVSPSRHLHGPIHTTSQKKARRRRARSYAVLYFFLLVLLLVLVIAPIIVGAKFDGQLATLIPKNTFGMVQPNHQNNNDTGDRAPSTVLRAKPAAPKFSTYWI